MTDEGFRRCAEAHQLVFVESFRRTCTPHILNIYSVHGKPFRYNRTIACSFVSARAHASQYATDFN